MRATADCGGFRTDTQYRLVVPGQSIMGGIVMRRYGSILLAVLIGGIPVGLHADDAPMAHIVFFKLKDSSQDAKVRLMKACEEYLAGHKGTVHFSVGVRAEDMDREVNDLDFDIALHLVFRTQADHDRYQADERHLKFVEEYGDSWSNVRVFDSYINGWQQLITRDAPDSPQGKRLPLPDPAASFAGMVRGTVVETGEDQIVLQVEKVVRQWEHSRAPDAEALVNKRVVVNGLKNDFVIPFLRSLKPGDKVTLDVAHREGEKLTLLELSEEQREQIRQ
jgi:hypothetical protein